MRLYEIIFRKMPKGYQEWMKDYLNYAYFKVPPEKYVGFTLIYGLLLALVVSFLIFISGFSLLKFGVKMTALISGFLTFFIFEAFMHSTLLFISDRISKSIEEILPDALRLISANIRSGLTPDKALLLSARSEFGHLQKEIRRAAKLSFSGESLEDAIKEIPRHINSRALKRSIDLLVEGIRRGGNLADLLDGLANDIRQTKILRREVHAYVMMYAIFIFFAAGIGAPLLYGISSFLVETMKEMGGSVNVEQTFTGGMRFMTFQGIQIEPEFLMLYSVCALGITAVFGGLLIGLIQEGSEKAGLKFIPILFFISISIFFLARTLVTRVFGTIV